jgi:hypothetical protein
MAFTFQGRSIVSLRWPTFRMTKCQQNDRKCLKDSRTHPWRPSLNNPWARRHCWDQLWSFLTENLDMRHIAVKFVPQLLTNDQKQQRVNVCLKLWGKAKEEPTFTRISRFIMGDESWIYCYDPETKQQSSQWNSPQSPEAKKAWQILCSTKIMLIVFFCVKWIVHCEFVPPNSTINSDFYEYCDDLRCLRENVWWERPELWRNVNWLLHHDNAPAHTSLKTTVCD